MQKFQTVGSSLFFMQSANYRYHNFASNDYLIIFVAVFVHNDCAIMDAGESLI